MKRKSRFLLPLAIFGPALSVLEATADTAFNHTFDAGTGPW
jgi:hypothetical protein